MSGMPTTLQTLDRDKLSRRSAREYQRKTGPRLVVNFKLNFARGQVYPRELLQKLRVQGLGLAREYDFGLVQGRHCAVDISLGIRPEVDRELAILLVIFTSERPRRACLFGTPYPRCQFRGSGVPNAPAHRPQSTSHGVKRMHLRLTEGRRRLCWPN